MLDHHDRGADDAGAVAEPARLGAQVARGEREGALEDDLADAGEQLLVGLPEVAAEEITAGLKKFTEPASTRPSARPGLADMRAACGSPARTRRTTSRLLRASRPRAAELLGQRAAAGDGLEAADIAAAAQDVLVAGYADVPDVARGALGAAVDSRPATMPQPMPVPTLMNSRWSVSRQCDQCSPRAMMLTSLSTSTGAS